MNPSPGDGTGIHPTEVSRPQRKLAALLVARDFPAASGAGGAREDVARALRALCAERGGREARARVEGLVAEFDSALDAARCAVAARDALAGRPEAPGLGVHLGDVLHREGEVIGEGVELAARLAVLAGPGGVCISGDVHRQIHNKLDVPALRLGRAVRADGPLPQDVFRLGVPSAQEELPAPRGGGRRAWVVATAAGLLVAVAAGALLLGRRGWLAEGDGAVITLAVADFVNETKEEDLDGLSGMLTTSLEQSRRLSVMTRAQMFDLLKQMDRDKVERIDESLGRELCQQAHVSALVLGSVRRFGGTYTIDLKVLDPARNETIFTARQEGRGKESIPRMLDKLSEATRVALKENQAEIRRANLAVAERTTTNFEAYQHYFLGEQLFAKVSSNADTAGVEAAAAEFQKAVERDPTFALAYYRLAFARLWIHDDPTGPIALAMRHLDRAPEKERLYIRACDARVQGRLDEAAALYHQVLAAYPKEKEARYALGDLEFHRWNLDEAAKNLQEAVSIDPLFALAYEHLIEALARKGDLEKALTYAGQYAERVPSEDSAHWLFSVLLMSRPLPEVEVFLRREQAKHPDRVEYVLASPRVKALMKDWTGAEADLRPLLESPRAKLRGAATDTLLWILVYRGRFREALALYDRMAGEAKARGDDVGYAVQLASEAELWAWGFRDAARLAELQGRVAATKNPFAEWAVARAWRHLGSWSQARKLMQRYPVLVSTSEGYSRVVELADAGRFPEAVKGLEVFAEITHHEGVAHMEIAELATVQGDPERVVTELDALFRWKLEPGEVLGYRHQYHPRGLFLLGKAYEARGEPKLAIQAYEQLLSLWKEADPDLADLVEAKARLAALKRAGR